MKKKFLAILLALGLVITCMPMVALAEGSGLSVDKTEVKKGETVRLTVTLPPAAVGKTLSGAEFGLVFDKAALEMTAIGDEGFTGGDSGHTQVSTANAKGEFKLSKQETNNGEQFTTSASSRFYADFTALKDTGNVVIKLSDNRETVIYSNEGIDIDDASLPAEFVKSVTLQLTGADGGKTLTKDAHIKGNVLDVTEEYNVVILYNDDAVYTYIPGDAKDSDIKETYQNAESSVTATNPTKGDIKGKWCGYGGDANTNKGFDGNQNRITIINGMDVAGTVTATAAKDTGIKGETFSINLTTFGEVDGSANYDILRKACITGSTEEQLNAAFDQCGSSDKFGTGTISTGGFSLGAINTQDSKIKYANIYYDLTGDPGTGMAKYGGTGNTTLGTITITVKAA